MLLSVIAIGFLGIVIGVLSNVLPVFGHLGFNLLAGSLYFALFSFYEATQITMLAPLFTAAVLAFVSGYFVGTFGSKLSKQFTGVGI